jgi:hypothetical protein
LIRVIAKAVFEITAADPGAVMPIRPEHLRPDAAGS